MTPQVHTFAKTRSVPPVRRLAVNIHAGAVPCTFPPSRQTLTPSTFSAYSARQRRPQHFSRPGLRAHTTPSSHVLPTAHLLSPLLAHHSPPRQPSLHSSLFSHQHAHPVSPPFSPSPVSPITPVSTPSQRLHETPLHLSSQPSVFSPSKIPKVALFFSAIRQHHQKL